MEDFNDIDDDDDDDNDNNDDDGDNSGDNGNDEKSWLMIPCEIHIPRVSGARKWSNFTVFSLGLCISHIAPRCD